ncbi:MAG: transporter permease [Gammaproteobacteria bacterium]|jgi:D-methionine transport system permease protein|nr:transporter permease [Gammaproteobacteria bacterium]
MFSPFVNLIFEGTLQTIYMVLVSGVLSVLGGVPLGIVLFITRDNHILENALCNRSLGMVVNVVRAIPFIILLIVLIPLTRLIVGSSIGPTAAIVPLSIGAIPFVARIVENALLEVNPGLIEAGQAMGASPLQIICKVLLPEAMPSIIQGVTVTWISLVGYSAMAGVVGAKGLGDIAVEYGRYRNEPVILWSSIALLIMLVYVIQYVGDWLARRHTR